MDAQHGNSRHAQGLSRRGLLQAGLAAGATLCAWPLATRLPRCGLPKRAGTKRGGILRVRGFDPPHFDPHMATANFTQSTCSFVYSKLVRHEVGADVQQGKFIVEPDLAERWEELEATRRMSSTCVKASNGTTSRPSMAASWSPRMSNSPMSAS